MITAQYVNGNLLIGLPGQDVQASYTITKDNAHQLLPLTDRAFAWLLKELLETDVVRLVMLEQRLLATPGRANQPDGTLARLPLVERGANPDTLAWADNLAVFLSGLSTITHRTARVFRVSELAGQAQVSLLTLAEPTSIGAAKFIQHVLNETASLFNTTLARPQ